MIVFVSLVITLGCIAASVRRLYFATNPTAFDPAVLAETIKASPERFVALVSESPDAEWEKELWLALKQPNVNARSALVNEQLSEFEYRVRRWMRVPRVCARITSTSGFLLASLVLRSALKTPGLLAGDTMTLATTGPVADALAVVTLGMMGTAFCLTLQEKSAKAEKANFLAVDKLVEGAERAFSR